MSGGKRRAEDLLGILSLGFRTETAIENVDGSGYWMEAGEREKGNGDRRGVRGR